MEEIIGLIKKAKVMYNDDTASIEIFEDESGRIYAFGDQQYEFENFEDLRNHLNS